MAYGQIDPARLEGEALRRWYLRSPADIEEERRSAAAQRHDQFFPRRDSFAQNDRPTQIAEASPGDFSETVWTDAPAGRWPTEHPTRSDARQGRSAAYQVAANGSAPRPSSHETPGSCISCHGRLPPPPLPPPFGTFPIPNGSFPSFRDVPRRSSPGAGSNPKQCTVQYENDSEICRWVPGAEARQRCWKSAAAREAYCIKSKGEVGYPELITK
jgi:hypothetical protein